MLPQKRAQAQSLRAICQWRWSLDHPSSEILQLEGSVSRHLGNKAEDSGAWEAAGQVL